MFHGILVFPVVHLHLLTKTETNAKKNNSGSLGVRLASLDL